MSLSEVELDTEVTTVAVLSVFMLTLMALFCFFISFFFPIQTRYNKDLKLWIEEDKQESEKLRGRSRCVTVVSVQD